MSGACGGLSLVVAAAAVVPVGAGADFVAADAAKVSGAFAEVRPPNKGAAAIAGVSQDTRSEG